jgi:Lrp/AsnC family transcriptional regulator
VSSAFAMEQIKFTTALPLEYAAEEKRAAQPIPAQAVR